MGTLLGLTLGIGLFLVWSSRTIPREPRRPRPPGRWSRTLVHAGLGRLGVPGLLGVCAGAGLLVGLTVQGVSHTAPVALVFGGMAAYLPAGLIAGRARRHLRETAEVWPEAVDHLASGVRAGLSLPDALAGLAERGPAPLRPAFAAFALDHQATGRFGDCLDRLKERLADPTGDRVCEGLRVAREVGGGDLGRLLRNLSGYLRDDARTRSELAARQSWTVNAARLAVAAPWVVLLLMAWQSEAIERYASPGGTVVLIGGGVVCVVAYRVMTWIGRLPEEPRVLS
ncbi:type II secretion system F family protein [Nocardioides sp. TRM66260-LWL]|uniref:type II secretion system F family protein n=1 Tax=Nocardioides sp. TRM66260-LWL TaxID=2874478 RepID=UPI001CC3864E|nr:type II secretion system F family protein [Nocardioides sp. TRM66260-LWL]MBZ5732899.1 type II secretion system F family protein [Nocardioides sp. TRM66260-LWL]